MIKRRFYKVDRGGRDSDSSSSSPSSDEEDEVEEEEDGQPEVGGSEGEEEEDEEDENYDRDEKAPALNSIRAVSPSGSPFASSGYESEDSSGNEITCDETAGLLFNDDEVDARIEKQNLFGKQPFLKDEKEKKQAKLDGKPQQISEPDEAQLDEWVLKWKSVFKCRLCPRIVCLTEASMETHLKSKRHTRSKKLLKEGRLKLMLNRDGELEEEAETHAERHTRTIALSQQIVQSKVASKNKGRQRQRQRRKAKMQERLAKKDREDGSLSINEAKKRRKVKD